MDEITILIIEDDEDIREMTFEDIDPKEIQDVEKLASRIEIGSDRLISFSASKKPGLKIGDFLTGSF